MRGALTTGFIAFLALTLAACGEVWNSPYPADQRGKNILYSAFTERPKHLDPVQSYSEDEATFNAQVYEPPLQYHYLKRPYTLVPMSAAAMPVVTYQDAHGMTVPAHSPAVAFSVYEISIKPGIRYQPHPALAMEGARLRYHALTPDDLASVYTLTDFPHTGTRDLVAEDFVYQIKRLAHPRLHSPIYGLMSEYIVGLKPLGESLKKADRGGWLDLRNFKLEGVEATDRYTFRVKLNGRYPQFAYWLAMNFFAPIPWEADRFYNQPGMAEKNLTLDWYPIGTGPYMLTENNPNARMVLERNPNYRGETYPTEGEEADQAVGLLADAGKQIPFVDKVIFTREREGIPYWNKFLQGYYDESGIASDSFDQAVRVAIDGEAALSPEMEAKGIKLATSVATSSRYLAFNWLDPVVGGHTERARRLRQAVAIAVDWEEFISIFANGRGIAGQGPVPPGIFGFKGGREGMNAAVYDWTDNGPKRKSIEHAKKLLADAGYPGGRDASTGAPLVLYLDTTDRGPGDKARLDWFRKQFAKIDVQLEIRSTDYNRFQEKVRKGAAQMFVWGWNADYPDPENFLFLFHTPQSRAKFQGENAANYSNPEFDALFERVKNMDNSPERQALIDRMVAILQHDAPWSFGFHPKEYGLQHGWLFNDKPNHMARNGLKYQRLDPALREARRREWNQPQLDALGIGLVVLVALTLPALVSVRRRARAKAR